MDFIEIEIAQWDKYQPRKDIKHPTWFALNNHILDDAKLFSLADGEWKALLYIFCQASQQNSAKVRLYIEHAKRVSNIPEKTLRTAIEKLTYAGVTCAYAIRTDALRDTQTDRQTEHTLQTNIVSTVAKLAPAVTPGSAEGLIEVLPEEIRKLYADEGYVTREAVKAWAWCKDNPSKTPKSVKGFRRFFSGWLERGWERHRKSQPSKQASGYVGIAQLLAEEEAGKAGA